MTPALYDRAPGRQGPQAAPGGNPLEAGLPVLPAQQLENDVDLLHGGVHLLGGLEFRT